MFENLECVLASGKNTNFGTCARTLKNAKALIFTPVGYKVAVSALLTFIADMNTKLRIDAKINRAQYISKIKGVEKANIANSTQTWGDGTTADTRDERVGRIYQLENLCAFEGLSGYNGQHDSWEVWMVMADGVVIGAGTTIDATGEAAIKGFQLARIFVSQYDEVINETQAMFTLAIELADADEWRTMVAFMPKDGNAVKNLSGLQNIEMEWAKQTPFVAGKHYIKMATACGGINIADLYPTEFNDPSLFILINQAGTVIDIDAIAVVTKNDQKVFEFSIDTADSGYVAATKLTLTMKAPSVLSAADIEWYEGESVTFPKS